MLKKQILALIAIILGKCCKAIGATIIEGRGSRVRVELNGIIATFHRPHPRKEAKPYQVRDARAFLKQIGILP